MAKLKREILEMKKGARVPKIGKQNELPSDKDAELLSDHYKKRQMLKNAKRVGGARQNDTLAKLAEFKSGTIASFREVVKEKEKGEGDGGSDPICK